MTIYAVGTELASKFDPYVEGTKTCPAGEIYRAGQDIRDLYAPLSVGSKGSDTGILIGNTDISNYFAAKGTASYWDGTLADLPTNVSDTGSDNDKTAIVEIGFLNTGELRQRKNYPFSEVVIGSWDGIKANSTNTEVRFTLLEGTLSINSASTWSALSSSRFFSIESSDQGYLYARVLVELRQTGNASTTISKEITISATHEIDGLPPGPGGI